MTKEEKTNLKNLLNKLRKEHIKEIGGEGYSLDKLYNYDDYYCLIEHIDGVVWAIKEKEINAKTDYHI